MISIGDPAPMSRLSRGQVGEWSVLGQALVGVAGDASSLSVVACVSLVSRSRPGLAVRCPGPTGDWARWTTDMRPLLPRVRPSRVRPPCPGRAARTGGLVEVLGRRVVGDAAWRRHEDRVRGVGGGPGCGEPAEAGAAVDRVLPGTGQVGDDWGAAAADDQGEPSGELADHVRGGHLVAGGVTLAAELARTPARIVCSPLSAWWCR